MAPARKKFQTVTQVFNVTHACSGFMHIVKIFPPPSMQFMSVSKVSPGCV